MRTYRDGLIDAHDIAVREAIHQEVVALHAALEAVGSGFARGIRERDAAIAAAKSARAVALTIRVLITADEMGIPTGDPEATKEVM